MVRQKLLRDLSSLTANRQSKNAGDILATRLIAATALGLVPTASVVSYQLLYKTSDQDGNPLATVTTIFVPLIHSKSKLLAFAIAEDSGTSKCAPSYQCE